MKIKTDSTPLGDPKNPDTCNLFALYKLVANPDQITEMAHNYKAGNYGYGHAKQAFYELILTKFSEIRERYHYFMENKDEIDKALDLGAKKAKTVASDVLQRVRKELGY
jgi:tryptophanyl-tRNA synthetase